MPAGKIFVIDDEPNIRDTIKQALEIEGYSVTSFDSSVRGLKTASEMPPDLMIADLVMPELDGLELLKRVKILNPEINVVMITGHASLESAISAIREGASDYVIKPFKIDALLTTVRKALCQKRFAPGASVGDKTFHEKYQVKNLVGTTSEMKEIFQLVDKVSKTESTVLIMGESGTGKEMVARSIHYQSKHRKGPFVSVNCAALPENLLESELFGYERGAFTGAAAPKMGLFELAESGSFLLDEVGEMTVNLQVKLLRVLQERILKRLGGIKDIPVDFRLIAATSKNLPQEVKEGRFREELFYRINVIPIVMPPLRERLNDIPVFVSHFLNVYGKKQDHWREFEVQDEAIEAFKSYQWPGNIRELENVIERIVALSETNRIDKKIVEKALGTGGFSSKTSAPIINSSNLREKMEVYERNLIEKALQTAEGNKNKAAQKLNLTRQALQYKLKKYGITSARMR
ncbi:MAG: hypothetical protein A3C35_05905 [Omnitrophica bacterium RIFCSPHIGHO2_02_FULL_46_11]|nr:MAG: hypothetical protein A3C35_05905 [Omnitrophica bacterium RIFCSPHIGHO2_02_FULL_46_11]OGW86349.1 MAG: hypothetical protein A3A81_07700 [Omnitrophica bacterium RIFCSPLOWO2_01_FULL_45_10b]